MICKNCGREITDISTRCICGFQEANGEVASSAALNTKTKLKKRGIGKFIAFLLVILIAIPIGYLVYPLTQGVTPKVVKKHIEGKSVTLANGTVYRFNKNDIKSIEVVSQDKQGSTNTVVARIQLNNGKEALESEFTLVFDTRTRFKKVLEDNIKPGKSARLIPLNAVDENMLKSTMKDAVVNVSGNNSWKIEEEEIKELKIIKRNTILEECVDHIDMEMSLVSANASLKGQVTVDLRYQGGKWNVENISKLSPTSLKFETNVKADLSTFTSQKLKSDIIGKSFDYDGVYKTIINGSNLMGCSVKGSELTNKASEVVVVLVFRVEDDTVFAGGIVEAYYKLDENKNWKLDRMQVGESMDIVYRKSYATDDIKKLFVGKTINVMSGKTISTGSTINVAAENIASFRMSRYKKMYGTYKTISIYVDYIVDPGSGKHVKGYISLSQSPTKDGNRESIIFEEL